MKLSELHYMELLYETRQSIAAKDVNLVYYLKDIERRLTAGEEAVKKVEKLKSMSTVEMMCENESVRQHVTEWETRCFKTEAELSDLHTRYVALCALCGTYKSEVAELEKEIFDIKSKTFCAYCGFEKAIDNDAPLKIEAHIFECKKHPVCILSKRIAELKEKLLMEDQKQNESYRVPYLEKEVERLQSLRAESEKMVTDEIKRSEKLQSDKRELVEALEQAERRTDALYDATFYKILTGLITKHKEAL